MGTEDQQVEPSEEADSPSFGSDDAEVDSAVEETEDGFDQTIEVTSSSSTGDRPQRLSAPNLTDARARTKPGLVPASQAIRDAENEDRRKIRSKIVYPVLCGAALQFVTADVVFVIYAIHIDWKLSPTVVTSWLSATVVQVVGVVLVVMNYLFPKDR